MVILPVECLLNYFEQEVVRQSFHDGELPCFGCFKRKGCPARLDLGIVVAHKLMEVEEPLPSALRCPRCKDGMIEWEVSGSYRRWACGGSLKDEFGTTGIPCNWTLSEGIMRLEP